MDILVILLIIAVILLIYELVIRRDEDKLDKTGHPLKRKK